MNTNWTGVRRSSADSAISAAVASQGQSTGGRQRDSRALAKAQSDHCQHEGAACVVDGPELPHVVGPSESRSRGMNDGLEERALKATVAGLVALGLQAHATP